jgi:hypothetical protein
MVLVDLGLIVSLKLTFMELDWNGTGLLTMEKLGEWCVRNGYQEVTMTTLQNMIRMVDTTYSQAVEFWEFLAIQIYMRLELQSTGIQMPEFLRFCCQSSYPRGKRSPPRAPSRVPF